MFVSIYIIKLTSTVNSLWSLANCNTAIKLASCEFENSPLPRKEGIDMTLEQASFQQPTNSSLLIGKELDSIACGLIIRIQQCYHWSTDHSLGLNFVYWTDFFLSLNTFLGEKLPLVISRIWTPVCAVVVHLVLPARPIVSDHHFSFTHQHHQLLPSS